MCYRFLLFSIVYLCACGKQADAPRRGVWVKGGQHTPPLLLPQAGEERGGKVCVPRWACRCSRGCSVRPYWSARPDLALASLSALADLTQPVHLEPVPFDLEVQSVRQPSKKRLDIASLE
ncbi:MAG: hypothetical protein KatS3mg058_2031 [Roseiflexus sp.]|nr:MAG: hypothetical protein KatS3mg058_2031 [Roseiflexus sp.]